MFYKPTGVYRGRDEIDRIAAAIKATHPDFRYQPIAAPEELGMPGESDGSQAVPESRRHTRGPTSSLPRMATSQSSIRNYRSEHASLNGNRGKRGNSVLGSP